MGTKIPRHSLQIAVRGYENKSVQRAQVQAAEAKLYEMEQYTEWPPRKAEAPKPEPAGLTLIDAYDKWLAGYTKDSSTWNAYSSVKRVLIEPLESQGVTLVKQVTAEHLKTLQKSWLDAGRPLNTITTWRRFSSCLFNYCVNILDRKSVGLERNPWLPVDVLKEKKPTVEQIMAGEETDEGIATLPLDPQGDNANWLLIQAYAHAFVTNQLPGQIQYKTERNPLFRHPLTFITFLRLMYETGLRRSDALIFRPDKIRDTPHGGSYTTVQRKTGGKVTCFLPKELVEQLRALPLEWRGAPDAPGAGLLPFYDGSLADQEDYMERFLNAPLRHLGMLLGIQKDKGKRAKDTVRPHRFRDSFAVNMLALGLSLEDLRRLLGHKHIKTTQDYYAPYVLRLQDALEKKQAAARQAALYAEAEDAAPKGNVVPISPVKGGHAREASHPAPAVELA
jgi:integrase